MEEENSTQERSSWFKRHPLLSIIILILVVFFIFKFFVGDDSKKEVQDTEENFTVQKEVINDVQNPPEQIEVVMPPPEVLPHPQEGDSSNLG